MNVADRKARIRTEALARRQAAHDAAGPEASAQLSRLLSEQGGRIVALYAPIRSEIDPMPALDALPPSAALCLPVVEGPDRPLRFRAWKSGDPLTPGRFGVPVPATGDWLSPSVVVVPLVAFDRRGTRLGYGGGFYDRTLAALRRAGPVTAMGFAYAVQEEQDLPVEPTDAALDLIVTEREIVTVGS